jgi:hypothetical protein
MAISGNTLRDPNNDLVLSIKHTIFEMENTKHMNVLLVWIPSHKGIIGNEYVDSLAKRASQEGIDPKDFTLPFWDWKNIFVNKAFDQWSVNWTEQSSKGSRLRSIQPDIPRTPWFKLLKMNKHDASNISRLRLGPCLTAQHLHRIGILQDPRCECGEEVQSIDHILLACPLRGCGDVFTEGNLQGPLSSISLLSMRPRDAYGYIVKCLRRHNIKI